MSQRTRQVCAKISKYDAAVAKLSELRTEVQQQQQEVNDLRDFIVERGAAAELTIAPTFHHAQAALDHMSANSDCTQVQVCKLLQEGQLPGLYFGQRVKICQRYLSTYKSKVSEGKTIKEGGGRPVMLDQFQLDFINTVIEYGQIRNKAVLEIQVAMLVRLMILIEHGYAHVDELDKRVITNPKGNRRKRSSSKVADEDAYDAAAAAPEDSDSDTDDEDESVNRRARDKAFGGLKHILGEALSKHLMLPHNYRYPCKRTVRRLCKSQKWAVKKGQQQSAHRFEGAAPDMLDAFFVATLKAYIQWGIDEPCQRHNCDEKLLCAEFEQSGRCVKVVVTKRPTSIESQNVAGKGRNAGTKSAPDRMICGITQFPFIGADNTTDLMVYIRKAASSRESDASAKQHEQEILDAVESDFAAKGIAVKVLTTETGYQNQESFKKSMCYFTRELLKKEGVPITFRDERQPTMRELGRLKKNHMLFLDNASCHDLANDLFRLDCLSHGVVLMPTPPCTTNITQALDQHVNKLFTLWMRQFFLRQIELEICNGRSGFQNELQFTAWAAQLKDNNPAVMNMPTECVIDVIKDNAFADQNQRNFIARLNAACEQSHLSGQRFSSAKVARLTVGPWLAALSYARASFECVGLAAPPFSNQVQLRSGPLHAVREEMQEALIRYELYPEKVKNTPIALAAAELASNRALNKTRSKQEICTKTAQLLNLLPQLEDAILVETSDREAQQLAVDSAKFVFGDAAPQAALTIASSLFQARDLLLAEQKKDRSMSAYLASTPPASLGELQARVDGQQSGLQASNENWLRKKEDKLKGKCDQLLKSAEVFCSSLTNLISKRDEFWNQRRGWSSDTTSKVKTRWNTAWAALRDNMMLVRDGRNEAPKRKSVEVRFRDLESAKAVIVSDKNKMEAKCKEKCVESASLASVLQLHAVRWSTVEEAMTLAFQKSNSFHIDAEAEFVEDAHPIALAVAAVADPAAAAIAVEESVALPAIVATAQAAAISAAPTVQKRKKSAAKKPAANNGVVDSFALESPPRSPQPQIARAVGGGVYVPPSWLHL
jgi:hypothetical protein